MLKRREKEREKRPMRRRGSVAHCLLCKNFYASPSCSGGRICIKNGLSVSSKTERECKYFMTGSYFWCKTRQCQIDTVACLHIRKKKYVDEDSTFLRLYKDVCKHTCERGRLIEETVRRYGRPEDKRVSTPPPESHAESVIIEKPKMKRRVR